MAVHIHIEKLVLENTPFSQSDAAVFRRALERELSLHASATAAHHWQSHKRSSMQSRPIAPNASSLSTWASASAQSLVQAIIPN